MAYPVAAPSAPPTVTPISQAPSSRPPEGKVRMPYSNHAERDVLCAVLNDASVMAVIMPILTDEKAFYHQAHQKIWAAYVLLHSAQVDIDLTTLQEELIRAGTLVAVGGREYLAQLATTHFTASGVEAKAKTIRDYYCRRQMIDYARELARLASDLTVPYADCRVFAEDSLANLGLPETGGGLVPVADLVDEHEKRVKDVQAGVVQVAYPCGLYDLDHSAMGFQVDREYIIAGRPGMGKSQVALNIAKGLAQYALANNTGQWIHYSSLEMPSDENIARMAAGSCKIPYKDIAAGAIPPGKFNDWLDANAEIKKLPIKMNDFRDEVADVNTLISHSLQDRRSHPPMAIIVDHIGLLVQDESNAKSELGDITKKFKNLAKRLSCPVILLCQLSRGVESRKDKHPMMSDLRDSGHIEQNADTIIGVYRDEYYNGSSSTKPGMVELGLLKNRGGADVGSLGWLEFLFDAPTGKVLNLASSTPKRLQQVPQPVFSP